MVINSSFNGIQEMVVKNLWQTSHKANRSHLTGSDHLTIGRIHSLGGEIAKWRHMSMCMRSLYGGDGMHHKPFPREKDLFIIITTLKHDGELKIFTQPKPSSSTLGPCTLQRHITTAASGFPGTALLHYIYARLLCRGSPRLAICYKYLHSRSP